MSFFNGVRQFYQKAVDGEKGEEADKSINQAIILAQLSQAESLAMIADVMPEIAHFLAVLVGAEEITDEEQLGRTKADLFWVVQPLQDADREKIEAMSKVLLADEENATDHRLATGEVLRRALHAYSIFVDPETAVARNRNDEDNE